MRGPKRGIVTVGAEGRRDAVMTQERGEDTSVAADLTEKRMAAVSGKGRAVPEQVFQGFRRLAAPGAQR